MPPTTSKVKRKTIYPDSSPRKMLAIPTETHTKLKKLAVKEDTSMSEIVRYLVELAEEGKVKIR